MLKKIIIGMFSYAALAFAAADLYAQNNVSNFSGFIAVTTTTPNFDVILTDNITFTAGGFSILSGAINGNGQTLNGNGSAAGFRIIGNAAETDVLFNGDITFNNFLNSVADRGTAAQGGGLFVGGSVQNISSGTATVTLLNSVVNFTNNASEVYRYGAAAQGGGLFAGGAVSAGAYNGTKVSSGGATTITFTSSTVNFTSNNVTSGSYGTAAQGGGLFAGGAVSAGASGNSNSSNSSRDGATTITFTGSTVNFTSNSATTDGQGETAQGGGLFAGGAVSAGAYGSKAVNTSSRGITTITFADSTVNFTSNKVISGGQGTASQGGGLFAGGSVSAGANGGGINISSGGTTAITFANSRINFTGNSATSGNNGTVAQGGGLFAGGAVSAGTYVSVSADAYSAGKSSDGSATIIFTSSTVNFASNSATSGDSETAAQGGGLFAGGAVSAALTVSPNYGINTSSRGITTITFADSTANFTSNSATSGNYGTAAQGGGFFAGGAVAAGLLGSFYYGTNNSSGGITTVAFTSSSANFTNNSAISGDYGTAAQGGGLFTGGAVSAGTSSNNKGTNISSGGITTIAFTSSSANFTNNRAVSGNYGTAAQGGGLFAGGAVSAAIIGIGSNNSSGGTATIIFNDSTVNFTNNSATSGNDGTVAQGGGLFAGGAVSVGARQGANISSGGITTIAFTGSTVNIEGNQATSDSGNTKAQGGGIFLGGSVSAGTYWDASNASSDGTATIDFVDSNINISGNTAGLGGGIFAAGSVATDIGSASNGNAAMNFTNSTINFTGNTAGESGGAIYIAGNFSADSALATDGTAVINFTSSTVSFTNNTASTNGGAIYAENGSEISFSGGGVTFEGNGAGELGGAIYMSGSTMAFNTDGGEVLFTGNKANSAPNDIYMDINSQLDISGANDVRFEGGIITEDSGEGIAINKSGAGTMYLGGDNKVWGDFNITGGDITMLSNATYAGKSLELKNGNTLDMNNGAVNTVNIAGNFASDTNLKMDVFSDGTNDRIKSVTADIDGNIDIFAGVGAYYKNEYALIITSGTDNLHGVFASSSIFFPDNGDLSYEIKYEDGIVKLVVDGIHITNFEALSPLTYNETQTAGAFKKISEDPGAWAPILNSMVIKQNNGTDADIAAVKDFLARTSGYFLANVIRNMAADSPNNEVYDKIRNHAEEHKTNSGLWVQIRGGLESFKKDENSLEDYNDLSLGVMLGFDRFLADKLWNGDLMWGVYGRINKDNVEQGKHKADGNKNGLGLYGGYIKDSWELKAMLLGSYDRFSTERAVMGEVAKADINGVTVSADVEAAIKIWMNNNMNFRPYAGVEAANTMYGGFKESGAGIYNLDVQSGNYLRTAGRVGAGLDYEKGIWIWYANIEGKYLIDGTKPEITSRFENTGFDFNSRGAEEGKIQIGAGVGGEVRISENWKGFANAKYYAAERYENLYGNVGVRYMFGKNKSKADNSAAARKKTEEARLEKERIKAEETQRIAEEAKITTEISDEDMAKQKVEAEERRKRPMLKTYSLTTNFGTNEYFLTDEFKEQIKGIADELKDVEYKKITIEGHTDSTGTKEWNKKLSRQRARSVYDEFAKAGVDKDKMTYEGFAAEMPVDSNKTAEGRAANRRTEIFVE